MPQILHRINTGTFLKDAVQFISYDSAIFTKNRCTIGTKRKRRNDKWHAVVLHRKMPSLSTDSDKSRHQPFIFPLFSSQANQKTKDLKRHLNNIKESYLLLQFVYKYCLDRCEFSLQWQFFCKGGNKEVAETEVLPISNEEIEGREHGQKPTWKHNEL